LYEATSILGIQQVRPLDGKEASALVDICEELDWECPVYGKLLAGFAAIAPINPPSPHANAQCYPSATAVN
jgi:hypothetical protein